MTSAHSTKLKQAVSYRDLCQVLEQALGDGFIPSVGHARSIREVLVTASECDGVARDLLEAVYRHNRCRHLDFPVALLPTLDGMGEVRGKLCDSRLTSPDQIARLEAAGEAALKVLSTPSTTIDANRAAVSGTYQPDSTPTPRSIRLARP